MTANIIDVNDGNFEEKVLNATTPVLVDCYADWCSPCKALKPLLTEIAEANEHITLGLLDIDSCPELAVRLKVTSIPKVIVFNHGEEITAMSGVRRREEYQQIVDSL